MPLLLYCSHNGWSDIALAVLLSRDFLRLNSYFLLSPRQLSSLPSLRLLGARTLPWEQPPVLQELLPTVLPRLLHHRNAVLWVFATGDFLSTGETDAFWNCTDIVRAARSPLALAPAVWSYQLLSSEPTCYLWIGQPEQVSSDLAPATLVERCSRKLLQLYDQQQQLLLHGLPRNTYEHYLL